MCNQETSMHSDIYFCYYCVPVSSCYKNNMSGACHYLFCQKWALCRNMLINWLYYSQKYYLTCCMLFFMNLLLFADVTFGKSDSL